ncbi:hypothetical protein HDZ31DRAFT_33468 [Schizophyllum fasciatum]
MSCSLCRLPFVPSPGSAAPLAEHFPPKGVLTSAQYAYFQSAVAMGNRVHGLVQNCEFCSPNMFVTFNPPVLLNMTWAHPDFTYVMMHRVCAGLFRRAMGCEGDDYEAYKRLSEVELVMGPLGELADAGALRGVDYASIGEKIDVQPFWRVGSDHGKNSFKYDEFAKSSLGDWLLTRPDTFPRFYPTVEEKHMSTIPHPDTLPPSTDVLTTQPLDVLRAILAQLDARTYIRLTSTCRFLRAHALTTFQPEARALVLGLPWALPTRAERERMGPAAAAAVPGASAPEDGDWLLYLSHAHRTKGMRVRRWLWAAAVEAARVFEERKGKGPYAEGRDTPERRKFDRQTEMLYLPPMFPEGAMGGSGRFSALGTQ